jgi:hypothetical protein
MATSPESLPTTDPRRPGPYHGKYQPADVFRAVLFGVAGAVFAVLMFPFFVGLAVLWLIGLVTARQSAAQVR